MPWVAAGSTESSIRQTKGWRVEAFNADADSMMSAEFQGGLFTLVSVAETCRTALMGSEAVTWRCHRRLLIADALIVAGWTDWDIMGPQQVRRHPLTGFACLSEFGLTYPAEPLFSVRLTIGATLNRVRIDQARTSAGQIVRFD